MYEIWIATSNKNKVREFKEMFEGINIIVKSLLDLTVPVPEIPETGTTFEENAFLKADYLSKMLNKPVLADDSGLEIIGLGNFPGVNTCRWTEPITDNNIINNLLIEKCRSLEERDAQAVCVLCYINPSTNETRYFRGITKGLITEKPVGNNVFGYDAIFFLPEISQTYAELTVGEKNKYSHRSKAFQMFKKWWLGGKYEDNKKINIILFEPEIAQNVGAIMRTCVAINAKLHLIEPFGFIFDERFIARSSANYVEFADYETYNDWNHFSQLNPIIKLYCATRYAQQPHSSINFTKEEKIFILFGRESTGIPTTILKEHLSRTFRIPMSEKVRSLNVANTVGIVGYEIMRQWDYPGLSKVETQKGADFLKQK